MRLLALDQASITSGYAIFIDGELKDCGKFTFEDDDIGIRLVKIRNKVLSLITFNNIDYVAFEDIQLQGNVPNNVQTFKVLSEVYGVILELVKELKIPCEIVHSSCWKSELNIKGSARAEQKRNAQLYVQKTYNLKATQDTCDAICIGQYVINNKNKNVGFDWSD